MKVWQLFENFKLSELNANFSELLTGLNLVKATYLTANKTVYVATTGSDTTGDGTSGKPYKTIAKALSMIPKNLNGFDAAIYIAGGIYDEDVLIYGYNSATLVITFTGNVTIKRFEVQESSFVIVNATSTYTLTTSTTSVHSIAVYRGSNVRFTTLNLVLGNCPTSNGIYVAYSSELTITTGSTTINNVGYNACAVEENSKLYVNSLAGSGNNVGISGTKNSIIAYGTKTISAITDHTLTGGSIITNLITMP